ncbi:MAG: hypothetical protein ACWGSD_14445, partial [Thermodesulfobacteriota bacterium]
RGAICGLMPSGDDDSSSVVSVGDATGSAGTEEGLSTSEASFFETSWAQTTSWARKITKKPVWILGASNCYEAHYLGDRDLADCAALTQAARKAYSMAGIRNPL